MDACFQALIFACHSRYPIYVNVIRDQNLCRLHSCPCHRIPSRCCIAPTLADYPNTSSTTRVHALSSGARRELMFSFRECIDPSSQVDFDPRVSLVNPIDSYHLDDRTFAGWKRLEETVEQLDRSVERPVSTVELTRSAEDKCLRGYAGMHPLQDGHEVTLKP